MPLPSAVELQGELTTILCRAMDARSPQEVAVTRLSLAQFLRIKKEIGAWMTEQVNAHLKEVHPR